MLAGRHERLNHADVQDCESKYAEVTAYRPGSDVLAAPQSLGSCELAGKDVERFID